MIKTCTLPSSELPRSRVEMLKTLEKTEFPVGRLTLLASARSWQGDGVQGRTARAGTASGSFTGVDVALSVPVARFENSRRLPSRRQCRRRHSSAFGWIPMALFIPEINGGDTSATVDHREPECTTAITLMALHPLHLEFRVSASSSPPVIRRSAHGRRRRGVERRFARRCAEKR